MEYLSHIQQFSANQEAGDYATLSLGQNSLASYQSGLSGISSRMTSREEDAATKESVDQNEVNSTLSTKIADMNAAYNASVQEKTRLESGLAEAGIGMEILKKGGNAASQYAGRMGGTETSTSGETAFRSATTTDDVGTELTSAGDYTRTGYSGTEASTTAAEEGGRAGAEVAKTAGEPVVSSVESGNPLYELGERNFTREAERGGMTGEDVDVGGGGVEDAGVEAVSEGALPTTELSSGAESVGETLLSSVAEEGAVGLAADAGEVALAGGAGLNPVTDIIAGGLLLASVGLGAYDLFGGNTKDKKKETKKEDKKQAIAESDSAAASQAYQDKIGSARADATAAAARNKNTYNEISSKLAQSNHAGVTIGVSAGARNY
jgi:hypothetical protein